MRPSTRPSASMMCHRLPAAAVSALAMNVDIPDNALSEPKTDVGDSRRTYFAQGRRTDHGRANPGDGKPKSYARFWGVSRLHCTVALACRSWTPVPIKLSAGRD